MKILIFAATLIVLFSCKESPEFLTIQKVNPDLYTINTGTSFYWCNPDNLTECVEASKDFMPDIIRFPGGLDANFYHMDGKGYGYRRPPEGDSTDPPVRNGSIENKKIGSDETISKKGSNDVLAKGSSEFKKGASDEDVVGRSEDESDDCRSIKRRYHMDNKKYPTFQDRRDSDYPKNENVIENVIQFCKMTKSRILFTCNILDASYDENKKVVSRLMDEGISIAGIEIGNEMYLPKFKCLKYGNVQQYIDTARWYTENLKRDFPGIKIAVIAAPPLDKAIPADILDYYREWNDALKKETFFDRYTVHHYIKDKTCSCKNDWKNSNVINSAFECYNTLLKNNLEYWFQEGIQSYLSMFPGKKMWLTEWNSHISLHCYGNTQADNLYFARYQNELGTKYSDNVEFATFHNWLGRGKHFPVLAPKGRTFEKRSSSLVFSMLKPLFSKRETYELKIPQQLAESMPDSLKIYAYHQPSTQNNKGNVIVVIVNPEGADHTQKIYTDVITIDGKQYKLNKGKYTMSHSRTLAASLGNPGFGDATESILTEQGEVTSTINLKGYSFTKITYELD